LELYRRRRFQIHEENNQKVHIEIKIQKEADKFSISVEDNDTGFDVRKTDFRFGLFSIQERLGLLFGEKSGINIGLILGKRTKITVWIESVNFGKNGFLIFHDSYGFVSEDLFLINISCY
jgi:light-regulated signal transduction histidine kinase (bacteriophytochrome)